MRDVIVVGAGGGGPVVAAELAQQGLDVLLLEGGPRQGNPEKQWSHLEFDANDPTAGFLRFGPGDRNKPGWFREWAQNSFVWELAGVGGTTQHFFGNSPRPYQGVFSGYDGADRARYDTTHRFPFTYAELVPYLEWVEETLPVKPAPMGTKEALFFRGCEGLGLPLQRGRDTTGAAYRPQPNCILHPGGNAGRTSDSSLLTYPQATGCTFCGHCFQGCYLPAKAPRNQLARRSTDNSYVPLGLAADRVRKGGKAVELRADSFVTQVHTAGSGNGVRASGVTWRDNNTGELFREDARVVVLAGGATETPRLWFNSGLPNPNDWVGRGHTDHWFDWVVGLFDEDTGNTRGGNSCARVELPGYGCLENSGVTPGIQAFTMSLSNSGIRGKYTNGRGMRGPWDGPTGRLAGAELKEFMANGIDHMLNVLCITDDHVEPECRIVPSAFPADSNGAVAKIDIDIRKRSAPSRRNREYVAATAARLLRKAGARTVYRMDWAPLLLHVHSSMRMGVSARNSVARDSGEARFVDRLFIADNSVLANSLGGPNPTLTTQAIATRSAEKIMQRYFGGDPWVRGSAPVVSTDDRITRRMVELGL
ncbi:GMC family oxidoreductase N-terminal domain-containing protein [Gordonia sp. NPDC003429]